MNGERETIWNRIYSLKKGYIEALRRALDQFERDENVE